MSDLKSSDSQEGTLDNSALDKSDPASEGVAPPRRGWSGPVFGLTVVLALSCGLAFGARGYTTRQDNVAATAARNRDLVPSVRVATVKASSEESVVTLPATTSAFAAANIFARASGYIDKRNVDIGDHVKAGELLAQITAPELDHQIAQAQATLAQNQAALHQAQANMELANVTNQRDTPLVKDGWVTKQQGDTDRLTLQAQQAAVGVAQANITAQQALLQVLNQQKAYQSVVAPFDGVITQRNIDVGSLVQADTTTATFMFTIMQANVMRTQVYVPQDEAFGVEPGIAAVIRVPEIPGRTFPGTVTRIANAIQPDTRTLLTEVDVPNKDGALRPGIYCTVELHIPRKTPSLLVPSEAVVFNSDGVHVALIQGGEVQLRKVSIARDLGTQVELSDGVKAGDQVVLNPSVDLAQGRKVQVQPEGEAKPAVS